MRQRPRFIKARSRGWADLSGAWWVECGVRERGKGAGCVQLSGFWDSLTGFGGGWFPMPRVTCVRGVGSSGVKQIDSGD